MKRTNHHCSCSHHLYHHGELQNKEKNDFIYTFIQMKRVNMYIKYCDEVKIQLLEKRLTLNKMKS